MENRHVQALAILEHCKKISSLRLQCNKVIINVIIIKIQNLWIYNTAFYHSFSLYSKNSISMLFMYSANLMQCLTHKQATCYASINRLPCNPRIKFSLSNFVLMSATNSLDLPTCVYIVSQSKPQFEFVSWYEQ